MKIHLGIEDMEPRNWVAWVFEIPGCYARASTREEAVNLLPDAFTEMLARLMQAGFLAFDKFKMPVEMTVAEEFRAFESSPDYLVNAFFENDSIPLATGDIEYAQCILDLNRRELLSILSGLPPATREQSIPGEVQKNINGILKHIGTAEWWYWDRFDMAFPREEWPVDVLELLAKVRNLTLSELPALVGSAKSIERRGEQWSARKLMRRTIWHERVHTLQIARYLKAMQQGV